MSSGKFRATEFGVTRAVLAQRAAVVDALHAGALPDILTPTAGITP